MADIARLTDLIDPEAKALGFELVRVKMMPSEAGDGGEALQIMAEDPSTGQLVIEQCAELSRRVQASGAERGLLREDPTAQCFKYETKQSFPTSQQTKLPIFVKARCASGGHQRRRSLRFYFRNCLFWMPRVEKLQVR